MKAPPQDIIITRIRISENSINPLPSFEDDTFRICERKERFWVIKSLLVQDRCGNNELKLELRE